jgi:ClpP class serine protease
MIFRHNNRMRMPKSYNGIVGELLTEFGVIGSGSGNEQSQKKKQHPPSPLPPTQLGDAAIRILNNNNNGNNSGSLLTMTDASSAMMVSSQQLSLPQPPLPPTPPPHRSAGGYGGIPSGASPPPGPTPTKGRVQQFIQGTGRTVGKALKVGGAIGGLIVGIKIVSHVKNSREVDDFFGSNDVNNNDVGGEKRSPSPLSTSLVNATNERKKKKHVLILPFENLKVIEPCTNTTSLFDNLRSKLINQDAVETTTIELHDLLRVIHSAAQNPNVAALHANFGEGTPMYPLDRGHATEIRNAIRIFNESHRYHHTPNINGSSSGSDNQSNDGRFTEEEKTFIRVLMRYLEQHDPNMHDVVMAQIKECNEKYKSGDPQFRSLTPTSFNARLRSTVGELHWKKVHYYFNHLLKQKKVGLPKYSHAFGHTYNFNTYYLASSCSYVHLQSRGYLNLFGNTASNVFLGGMLHKYGITAHVFKHGQYKNAPSIFTQSKYTQSHLENVTSMISSLNSTMCTLIEESRTESTSQECASLWKQIFNYGSVTAMTSVDIGLVDTIPPIDPVNVLMDMNKKSVEDDASKKKTMKMTMSTMYELLLTSLGFDGAGSTTHPTLAHTGHRAGSSSVRSGQQSEQVLAVATTTDTDVSDNITRRAKFEKKFGKHVSYSEFAANESITLSKYLGMLKKKDTVERTRRAVDDVLHRLSVSSTATSMILSSLGLRTIVDDNSNHANYNSDCDKIAVLTVDGGIDRKCSNRVVRALREIKNDKRVKAVVLRVNSPGGSVVSSELILEEIKNLDKVRRILFLFVLSSCTSTMCVRSGIISRLYLIPFISPSFVQCQMQQLVAGITLP